MTYELNDEIKLCIDCKHCYVHHQCDQVSYSCRLPETSTTDPVTGSKFSRGCDCMRSPGSVCGRSAFKFAPKQRSWLGKLIRQWFKPGWI